MNKKRVFNYCIISIGIVSLTLIINFTALGINAASNISKNTVNNTKQVITTTQKIEKPKQTSTKEQVIEKQQKENKTSGIENSSEDKYKELEQKISKYLSSQNGSYGMYFISLKDGQSFGYNSDQKFTGASTVKVPIDLYVYELIRQGKIGFDTKYQYTSDDSEGGTGIIQNDNVGGYYSVKYLLEESIRVSDNVAVNILLREMYGDNFFNYIGNVVGHSITPWNNEWSAKDMAYIMKEVYNFNNNNLELGKDFLTNLENTVFNDRINKYLPSNVAVAHKIGNQVGTMNDVGIVFVEDQPYVVAFMSSNVEEDQACEVIAQASKMIYDFQVNKK